MEFRTLKNCSSSSSLSSNYPPTSNCPSLSVHPSSNYPTSGSHKYPTSPLNEHRLCNNFPSPNCSGLSNAYRSRSLSFLASRMTISRDLDVEARQPEKMGGAIVIDSPHRVKELLLDAFDVFIFDMDGVLWRTEDAILGAKESLDFLKAQGKQIFFATNNSLSRSQQFVDKMKRVGLGDQDVSAVFNSANAAALCLKQMNYKGKVYMIGNDALKAELKQVEGVELIDGDDHKKFILPADFSNEEIDMSIGAVVMGFDPNFNYYKACFATALLIKNPDALFIVTNQDVRFPSARWTLPGTGSFVSVIETATGRKGVIAGKPGPVILNEIQRKCPTVPKSRICMVGDNLHTDIDFGRSNGIGTLLVETGVHTREDFGNNEAPVVPDFVIPSIANLNLSI